MTICASIDVGSQTIRLLVAEVDGTGTIRPLHRDRAIVRLGEHTESTGILSREAVVRGVDCIRLFVESARRYNAESIRAVATACVRNAVNADTFLSAVSNTAGIAVDVISGPEEAYLSLLGVRSCCTISAGHTVVLDIGGGSTEYILLENAKPVLSRSINLGVIGLSERFLHSDPPTSSETDALKRCVQTAVEPDAAFCTALAAGNSRPLLIGTAGTVTTLAAVDLQLAEYDPDRVNGHILKYSRIQDIFTTMSSLPLRERRFLPGLEEGRALVILSGTVILACAMQSLGCRELTVSDAGLLEGILLREAHAPPAPGHRGA